MDSLPSLERRDSLRSTASPAVAAAAAAGAAS